MQSPGPESWHPNPDFLFQEGGGPLFDIGPYYLTALSQSSDRWQRVTAAASTARPVRVIGSGPRAGEEFAVTVPSHLSALYRVRERSVSPGDLQLRLAARAHRTRGLRHHATIVFPDPNTFEGDPVFGRHRREGSRRSRRRFQATRGTGVVELARAIRAGRPERASGEQAYHVLDIMVSTTSRPVVARRSTSRAASTRRRPFQRIGTRRSRRL